MARYRPVLASLLVFCAVLVLALLIRGRKVAPEAVDFGPHDRRAAEQPALAEPEGGDSEARAAAEPVETATELDEETSEPGGQRVRVLDLQRNPIAGARVRLLAGAEPTGVTTDREGRGLLEIAQEPGMLDLRADAEGFLSGCLRTMMCSEVEIRLARATTVRGVVFDRTTGQPLVGAIVDVLSRDRGCPNAEAEYIPAISDIAGRFELSQVPCQSAVGFRVRAEGYRTESKAFRIEESGTRDLIELDLERGVELTLEVVDMISGAPLPGARVRGHETLSTDAAGRLTTTALLGISEAHAYLEVLAEGRCTLRAKVSAAQSGNGEVVRLPLPITARIEGIVRDEQGRALSGVAVYADMAQDVLRFPRPDDTTTQTPECRAGLPVGWYWLSEQTSYNRTDAEGRFRSHGFVPWLDRIDISLEHRGYRSRREIVGPLGGPGSSFPVELVMQEKPAVATGSLQFRLTLNGQPILGEVVWRGATRVGSTWLAPGPATTIEKVEIGTVALEFKVPQVESKGCALRKEFPASVQVRANETTQVQIALELPTAVISGRVTDWRGEPVPALYINASNPEACLQGWGETDPDGKFQLEVGSDVSTYRVAVNARIESICRESVAPGSADVDFTLPGIGLVRCRIACADSGKPPARVQFRWRRTKGGESAAPWKLGSSELPDAGGWFQLELPAGPVEMIAFSESREADYLPSEATQVVVVPDAPPRELELVLEQGLDLELVLEPGQEPPSKDVSIYLVEEVLPGGLRVQDAPIDSSWKLGEVLPGIDLLRSRSLRFRPNGRATLRQLRPGAYRFVVHPQTIEITPQRVVVKGGVTDPIELSWMRK
jgi:hypothetical protein